MKRAVFTVGAVLRGDDAAGPMLAKMLEDEPAGGWTVIDGGQMPEDMLGVVRREAPETLVLVDAAAMGLAPGTIRILDENEVESDYLITTHSLPLAFLITELKKICRDVLFLGIQVAQTEFMAPLSPPVLSAVERIYATLAQGGDLGELIGLDDETPIAVRN